MREYLRLNFKLRSYLSDDVPPSHVGSLFIYGVIHILRNHQGGEGFRNYDYANVNFALSNAEFDHGRGRGSRNRQKEIT